MQPNGIEWNYNTPENAKLHSLAVINPNILLGFIAL